MGPLAPCIRKAKDEHSPREYIVKVPLNTLETSLPCFILFCFLSFEQRQKKYKATQ